MKPTDFKREREDLPPVYEERQQEKKQKKEEADPKAVI